jgi:hypothetical protein
MKAIDSDATLSATEAPITIFIRSIAIFISALTADSMSADTLSTTSLAIDSAILYVSSRSYAFTSVPKERELRAGLTAPHKPCQMIKYYTYDARTHANRHIALRSSLPSLNDLQLAGLVLPDQVPRQSKADLLHLRVRHAVQCLQ